MLPNLPAFHKHAKLWMFLLGLAVALPCQSLFSESSEHSPAAGVLNRKVELLSEALRARSAGEWDVAREHLRTLHEMDPEDESILRLLNSVEEQIRNTPIKPSTQSTDPADVDALPQPETPGPVIARAERSPVPTPTRHRPPSRNPQGNTLEEELQQARSLQEEQLARLLALARAQWDLGDHTGAANTYTSVESIHPGHEEAVARREEIARMRLQQNLRDRPITKIELLSEVAEGWRRPRVFDHESVTRALPEDHDLRERMERIQFPRVHFAGVPLSSVLDTLSILSEEHDPEGIGINIILMSPDGEDPSVHITLRQLPLHRILDFIAESVGFEYEVQSDAVVVRRGVGEGARLETEFFPITRSTIIRLTGLGAAAGTLTPPHDPFAPRHTTAPTITHSKEETALRNFLQRAGVPFDNVPGANLALADGQIIVTQTARNMERVRNILRRYSEVKQVEIESRFLEVQQGDLEELGFHWLLQTGARPMLDPAGNPITSPDGTPALEYRGRFQSDNRTLGEAFQPGARAAAIDITGPPGEVGNGGRFRTPVGPPELPSAIPLASGAGYLAAITGVIGSGEIDLLVRALARSHGSDLMSAPKITVLSGKTAQIVVAQELRYPENYGDVRAQVGRGDSGAGSAGVAITSGTPLDFAVRNIGVEMEVTPTVEDDNSISLLLEPKVTEFEGFVEYGGPNIAIASNRTVTIPSGFYQPIFSVRRVRTEVTIWDGATVVMGGLTREQAVTVEDKVPLLGDLPLLGRLFRSKAESSQKRNLLIFVTANLISPGGSPMRQQVGGVPPGSLYQNSSLISPSGTLPRASPEEP